MHDTGLSFMALMVLGAEYASLRLLAEIGLMRGIFSFSWELTGLRHWNRGGGEAFRVKDP